jgi:hypothetical protein
MPTPYKAFASLLYYHLINSGKYEVSKVAAAMGISASQLYKYCEGDSAFPNDLLPALYNATKEKEFLDFGHKGTDRMSILRPGAGGNARSIELETLDVMTAVGELTAGLSKALDDGKLSEMEARKIEQIIGRLFDEAEGVRQKLLERKNFAA